MGTDPASLSTHKLGVCILTFNSEDVIERCVESVRRALAPVPHEIVVVDNASSDRTVEVVRGQCPDVPVVANDANLGYARGHNCGAKYLLHQGCDYLAFLNPDLFVLPDTLVILLKALLETPSCGCVGGTAAGRLAQYRRKPEFLDLLLLDGLWTTVPLVRELLAKPVQTRTAVSRIPRDPALAIQPAYAVPGGCVMLPAAVFGKIGGFDEATFLFFEEYIISERLRAIGLEVCGVPAAQYEHIGGHSTRRRLLSALYAFVKSEYHFTRAYCRWPVYKAGALFLLNGAVIVPLSISLVLRWVKRRLGFPPNGPSR